MSWPEPWDKLLDLARCPSRLYEDWDTGEAYHLCLRRGTEAAELDRWHGCPGREKGEVVRREQGDRRSGEEEAYFQGEECRSHNFPAAA